MDPRTKIVFFDIDGTLISERTQKIPESTVLSIRKARLNGHKMFINTGRCYQAVEEKFRAIGFDGYICGCGTHVRYHHEDLLYVSQPPDICALVRDKAKECRLDIVFESRYEVCFDETCTLRHAASRLKLACRQRGYDLTHSPYETGFTFDKFCVWWEVDSDFPSFLKTLSPYFDCIDRGNQFYEFVPRGYSKATGIQYLLDYFGLPLDNAYAIGDSNNDLPMLHYVPHSIAMGNSSPRTLFDQVSFVTKDVDDGGIAYALEHFELI